MKYNFLVFIASRLNLLYGKNRGIRFLPIVLLVVILLTTLIFSLKPAWSSSPPDPEETYPIYIGTEPCYYMENGYVSGGTIIVKPSPEGSPDGVELTQGELRYKAGSIISLQAKAYPGYRFDAFVIGWRNLDNVGYRTEVIKSDRIDGIKIEEIEEIIPVTARFLINEGTLHLFTYPPGSGKIRVSPKPSDKKGSSMDVIGGVFSYEPGTSLVLAAKPAEGYRFTDYTFKPDSSDVTNQNNSKLSFLLKKGKAVIAKFEPNVYTLKVNTNHGDVEITQLPDGPTTLIGGGYKKLHFFEKTLPCGTKVELKAIPNEIFPWKCWRGNVSDGPKNPIIITLNSDRDILADFRDLRAPYLNLVYNHDAGSVERSPEEISRPEPDSFRYSYGEEVTLKAVPKDGYEFIRWRGHLEGAAGKGSQIKVKMDRNRRIGAVYKYKEASSEKTQKEKNNVVRFDHPKYKGIPVDRCARWSKDCGEVAAHQFCKKMGYDNSPDYGTAEMEKTYVIGDGKICRGSTCDGFTYIDCELHKIRDFTD